MAADYDVIVIGSGHNGLVCGAYLARAGLKTLVLERREIVGGAAVTEEFAPGFRASRFSYVMSLLHPRVIRDLELPSHSGLQVLPANDLFCPLGGDDYIVFSDDFEQARRRSLRASRGTMREIYPAIRPPPRGVGAAGARSCCSKRPSIRRAGAGRISSSRRHCCGGIARIGDRMPTGWSTCSRRAPTTTCRSGSRATSSRRCSRYYASIGTFAGPQLAGHRLRHPASPHGRARRAPAAGDSSAAGWAQSPRRIARSGAAFRHAGSDRRRRWPRCSSADGRATGVRTVDGREFTRPRGRFQRAVPRRCSASCWQPQHLPAELLARDRCVPHLLHRLQDEHRGRRAAAVPRVRSAPGRVQLSDLRAHRPGHRLPGARLRRCEVRLVFEPAVPDPGGANDRR